MLTRNSGSDTDCPYADVVTGASQNSLAAEAAFSLAQGAQSPAQIILLGRSNARVQPVIDRIRSVNGTVKTAFIQLDLSDLSSVRRCAAEVQAATPKIDVLINSAGIMALEKYEKSVDGFEMQLAACHIGHFLLTGLLLPQLAASGNARVVTLTSMAYEIADFRFDDWNFSEGATYERWTAYGQAKTANFMFSNELARRATAQRLPIEAFVVHPGVILSSGILKAVDEETLTKAFEQTKAMFEARGEKYKPDPLKSIEEGSSTMLVASLQPGLKSGSFLRDCNVVADGEKKAWVKDAEKAKQLWELSEELVKEKIL